MSDKKYTADDMFNDIDEMITNSRNQSNIKAYTEKNSVKQPVIKRNEIQYASKPYNEPVIYKNPNESEIFLSSGSTFKSQCIIFLIISLTLLSLNSAHLIFVLILPIIFMMNNFATSEFNKFIILVISCSTVGLYMLLFHLPAVNYSEVDHWLTNFFLSVRFSAKNINDHNKFLMSQSLILACVISVYLINKLFFEKAVKENTPIFVLVVKSIVMYAVFVTLNTYLLFELLRIITIPQSFRTTSILGVIISLFSGFYLLLISSLATRIHLFTSDN